MDELFLATINTPFNSPDIGKLEFYDHHLLFDCGAIKLEKEIFCSAYTVEKMSLFIRQEDRCAVPVRVRGVHRARVGGAIYKVHTEELVKLDKRKQNRVLFERKRVDVYVPYADMKNRRDIMILPEKVWFYGAISDVWEDSVNMSMPRYNISPSNPPLSLAKTYRDDEALLNNHFRYSDTRLEDMRVKPPAVEANGKVHDYVHRKNTEAIQQLSLWKRLTA